jgi:hypothetical protein
MYRALRYGVAVKTIFYAWMVPAASAGAQDAPKNIARQVAKVRAEVAPANKRVRFHGDWDSLAQYRTPEQRARSFGCAFRAVSLGVPPHFAGASMMPWPVMAMLLTLSAWRSDTLRQGASTGMR